MSPMLSPLPPAMSGPDTTRSESLAHALEASGRPQEALAAAWSALTAAPGSRAAKGLVARLLRDNPDLVTADMAQSLRGLLADPQVDPGYIGAAGWRLLLRESALLRAGIAADPRDLATWLEHCGLALDLLRETFVRNLEVELPLTALRRWLLLRESWREFPNAVEALATQAVHNGGAWLIDEAEQARLEADVETPIAHDYAPLRHDSGSSRDFADPVTGAVAKQYEGWPYPPWSRIMVSKQGTLPALVKKLDPDGPDNIPVAADILVAGCGTGRETAILASHFPDARITAIDISEASLRYGTERCARMGLRNIEFRPLDLHDVSALDRRFHAIVSSGVLHHLPDPEKGWGALADALVPGGVMRVMLYSRTARLRIHAAQKIIADLAQLPVDADLLRTVRRRLIAQAPGLVAGSLDFYTLAGIHDLLLHRQEVFFDVPRISAAIARVGLRLLAFSLPTRAKAERYRAENPADVLFRDIAAWAEMERREPLLFSQMYDFWCRKPMP